MRYTKPVFCLEIVIKSLIKFVQDARAAKKLGEYDFECKECGETVNAMEQAGICPHIPIKEFIYGSEPVADAAENDRAAEGGGD